MSATLIIARSEFLRRVKSKGFIITTLLAPLALIGFGAVIVVITFVSVDAIESDLRTIGVVDETGFVLDRILADGNAEHALIAAEAETAREETLAGRYDAYVVIGAGVVTGEEPVRYFAAKGGGFGIADDLRYLIRDAVRKYRMEQASITQETLDIIYTNVDLQSVMLGTEGEEAGSSLAYGGVGAIMGFMIYITMLLYGTTVMQGVMEEKQTRIVEVIVSSARPFSLLMGKVLGIGAMGLTQLATWAVMIFAVTTFGGMIFGLFMDPASLGLEASASTEDILAAAEITLPSIHFSVFIWFVLYFAGGYLLYAGLFAAAGSMVEQQQDAQTVLLPLLMPIIVSIVFISPVLQSPNSTLAVVLSLIPFTAPVPMVVRLAVTDIPLWEVLLSYGLLVAGFVGTIWVSSRIYRVGILMYGKKASLKDAVRWLRHG